MTAVTAAIAAVLNADATLLTTLTGGAYSWDQVGRNGISNSSTPNAYNADGLLKPTAIVNQRSELPWGGGHDSAAQWKTLRTSIEIYLYSDGDSAYSVLETPLLRIQKLLDEQYVPGAGMLKQTGRYDDRDPNMNNAIYIMATFQVVFSRQLT